MAPEKRRTRILRFPFRVVASGGRTEKNVRPNEPFPFFPPLPRETTMRRRDCERDVKLESRLSGEGGGRIRIGNGDRFERASEEFGMKF